MRERFDSEYIRSELERLGDRLDAPLTVYLIGGGSMAFRDLKETTKDIDLVVTDGDALRQLQGALLACGYEIVRDPGEEYDELGAQRILENDDGCRIDVFNRQVVDKFSLSEGMRERSEAYLNDAYYAGTRIQFAPGGGMPDGIDPGWIERHKEREKERGKRKVEEPRRAFRRENGCWVE